MWMDGNFFFGPPPKFTKNTVLGSLKKNCFFFFFTEGFSHFLITIFLIFFATFCVQKVTKSFSKKKQTNKKKYFFQNFWSNYLNMY